MGSQLLRELQARKPGLKKPRDAIAFTFVVLAEETGRKATPLALPGSIIPPVDARDKETSGSLPPCDPLLLSHATTRAR